MTKLKEGWGWGGVLAAKKSAESLGGHKQKVFVPNADHTLSQTVKIKVKKNCLRISFLTKSRFCASINYTKIAVALL